MRIDKFLWAVRLYKTRSMATNAIKSDKIKVNGESIKPSRKVEMGDEVEIFKAPIWRTYRVKEIIEQRVSAAIAQPCIEEITSEQELNKLEEYLEEKRFYLSR
ncbi:RNA-binding S4 domain-containing protein [Limibacter armeniacum]|uniref:RNA-binding S4 domain-containing protein n=1 Tax=Limibacter armeniacum TaxID=466084 RepID=UPI002FE5C4CA